MCHLLHRSQNDLKLERISTNQNSVDLNHDSVSLVAFSPSPCVKLKWISMKLSPRQVLKATLGNLRNTLHKLQLNNLLHNSKHCEPTATNCSTNQSEGFNLHQKHSITRRNSANYTSCLFSARSTSVDRDSIKGNPKTYKGYIKQLNKNTEKRQSRR